MDSRRSMHSMTMNRVWVATSLMAFWLQSPELAALAASAPVLYPADQTQSPIDVSMVQGWKNIAAAGSGLQPAIFMKVGDSQSILSYQGFVNCFNGDVNGIGPITPQDPWLIYLDGRDYLKPTILYFRSVTIPDAAQSTPYGRDSLATVVGTKAGDCLAGSNPTLLQEFNATHAQYAIIMFGSNDIQGTLPTNIEAYETGLRGIVDILIGRGVIPILTTMPQRQDQAAYPFMVPAFNGVVRAIAQGRQIPLIDLHRELWPLTNHGLSGDNVHLSILGSFESCQFRASQGELDIGMNVRNLISMQSLDRIKSVMVDNAAPPDSNPARLSGDGSAASPFMGASLPFVDMRDTRASPVSNFTNYSCPGSPPAPGPEYLYRLNISQPTAIRALVLDANANAVSISLLSAASANSCMKSGSRMIETTLNAGTYYFAVDSLNAGGGAEYTLSITACVAGDTACGPGTPLSAPARPKNLRMR